MSRLILLIVVALTACSPGDSADAPGDHGVSERIAEQVRNGEGTTINLGDLTPFEWTRFYVFSPYTPKERAEGALGFRWPYTWRTSIDHDEVANFLVFVNNGNIVAAFDHSRDKGDFAYLDSVSFPPDSARFVVQQRRDSMAGTPHLVLQLAL